MLSIDDRGSSVKNIIDKFLYFSLYVSNFLDYNSKFVNTFLKSWRKSVRYLILLQYTCQYVHLSVLCNDLPVHVQLHSCFLFLKVVDNTEN